MSKSYFLLKKTTSLSLIVLLGNITYGQNANDTITAKNITDFALQENVKEVSTLRYFVEITPSTDSLVKFDTTYTLTSGEVLTFDSLGKLEEHSNTTYKNKEKVKERDRTIYSYTINGDVNIISFYENEDLQYRKTLVYNNDNQLAEVVKRDRRDKLETTTLYYYKEGKIFNIKVKDENNVMLNFIRLNYNSNGYLKEREYRGETMQLLHLQKYIYDTLNDGITRLNIYSYAIDEKLRALYSYQYDNKGNTIQQTITDSNKRVTLYQTNAYNDNNELVKEVNFSDGTKKVNTYQYIYDEYNNWTTQTFFQSGQLVILQKRTITYYTKEKKEE